MISKILVLFLAVDAAWVAYRVFRKKTVFEWIFVYWVILTIKNLCDLGGIG